MSTTNLQLPFDVSPPPESRIDARDRESRARAVDPRYNVALEASAGTGKTRVLVDRYVNLLRAGVDPSNILAITFTRKAAAEMRERIMSALRTAADRGEIVPARWRELRDRTGDIEISTIDAFCLSLLREFPLEADLDPGFAIADDTEVPRLIDESLDRALRACRSLAREDEHVALVFAQLSDRRARAGLAALLARRIVAPQALSRFLAKNRRALTVDLVAGRAARALLDVFMRGGQEPGPAVAGPSWEEQSDVAETVAAGDGDGFREFVASGPSHPVFMLLVEGLHSLDAALRAGASIDPAMVQAAAARARDYFLTQDGQPRRRLLHPKALFTSPGAWERHRQLVVRDAPLVADVLRGYRRDLNVLVSRGVWRMFRIAEAEYRRTLDAHAVLDFSDLLLRALDLLRHMEEFSQSRYRLESRYHHVLVDEFQDTSRAQWELIELLVRSWGEGAGLAFHGPLPPSIFIVGDRKQSIYRFRDADVSVMADATRHLEGLRPGRDVRRSIARSFRAVPALLAFVNDLCHDVEKSPGRADAFRYDDEDRFPVDPAVAPDRAEALGVLVAGSSEACADAAAEEIARLLAAGTTVREVASGVPRPIRPGDIAILFRTRESHREFEEALGRRGIPAYVYKGLGFFDADEIRDVHALLAYLAEPLSDLRAAAWLRSGFVRLSDDALRRMAPHLAARLADATEPAVGLDAADAAALELARRASARWRDLVDRIPAAELLDVVLSESAYAMEMRGARVLQARENIKKVRGLVRRAQNRGYATLGRIVEHLDRLAVGDESNAAIDAGDAVSLMTVHAAKGLEFPVVLVVNLDRGTGGRRHPIRVATGEGDTEVEVSVGDFQSRSDEDEAAVEREETKRLLYVALTRARDRLYLGAVTKDGAVQAGSGSLAEVLPASFREGLTSAVVSGPEPDAEIRTTIRWRASSGATHFLLRCPLAGPPASAGYSRGEAPMEGEIPQLDYLPVDPGPWTPARVRPHAMGAGEEMDAGHGGWDRENGGVPGGPRRSPGSERLRGVLVHRLMQRLGLPGADDARPELDGLALRHHVLELIRDEEREGLGEPGPLVEEVVHLYRRLCDRQDLRELYGAGQAFHEVPFSAVLAGVRVRGTIDLLIRSLPEPARPPMEEPAERVTVVELKTGRPRASDDAQMALYRQAAEVLFPDALVSAKLVYLEGTPSA